ncbi:hypothetical protein F5Y17DRAFT_436755 [Xylariaceae sp. FL0594]|nr:hypothetical protein F5Y17DRAFT_436755 [Xylariaceae sp. FL0594]
MAPYTMKIYFKNPVSNIKYIGSARLPGDGWVSMSGWNVNAGTETGEAASLAKDDGTEGLWMATLFAVEGCRQNLLVTAAMSTAKGSVVVTKLAFVDAKDSSTLWKDWYYNPEDLGLTSGTAISKGETNASGAKAVFSAGFAKVEATYPDASCTISVTHVDLPVVNPIAR